MAEHEKRSGFFGAMKGGIEFLSRVISAGVFPRLAEGVEMVMEKIDGRILRIEKRILREISNLMIVGLGGLFLVLGLFFLLRDYLGWNSAAAFVSIGLPLFAVGILLKHRH